MYQRLPRFLTTIFVKRFSTINSNILKPYPNYVERQTDLAVSTTSGDDLIEIDRETKQKVPKPSTVIRTTVNYIDTNPLNEKNQPLVLLVHGYPGTHQSTINLIEHFQRRNFRCIAPDMPCKTSSLEHDREFSIMFVDCGKTKMPLWAGLVWQNSVFLRGRFLGEFLKDVMKDKLA